MPQLATLDLLVVDDHGPTLRMLCGVFRALGLRSVRGVSDGPQALHALAERCPDVMIVDWEMPGINGLDLVHFLRTSPDSPARSLPIMMISAHSTRSRVLKARALGVNEFLVKPVKPHILAQRLWQCMNDHETRTDASGSSPSAPIVSNSTALHGSLSALRNS